MKISLVPFPGMRASPKIIVMPGFETCAALESFHRARTEGRIAVPYEFSPLGLPDWYPWVESSVLEPAAEIGKGARQDRVNIPEAPSKRRRRNVNQQTGRCRPGIL